MDITSDGREPVLHCDRQYISKMNSAGGFSFRDPCSWPLLTLFESVHQQGFVRVQCQSCQKFKFQDLDSMLWLRVSVRLGLSFLFCNGIFIFAFVRSSRMAG